MLREGNYINYGSFICSAESEEEAIGKWIKWLENNVPNKIAASVPVMTPIDDETLIASGWVRKDEPRI